MSNSFPYVTANINSAITAQTPDERSILIIGGMVAGTAASGDLVEDLNSVASFNAAFGRTSHIAKAGRACIKNLSVSRIRPRVSAIGLVDAGAGVAAVGSIVFANNATAAGTIKVYVDSLINGKYEVAVAVGDTPTEIGDALVALITANLDSPVTAANVTGTVTLTAVNLGTEGNTIGLKYDLGTVTATTVTLTAFASGATNPVLTTLFDVIANKRYTTIVYPGTWDISTLTTETESRFNIDNNVLDGLGTITNFDTFSNTNASALAFNQKTLATTDYKLITRASHKGSACFESNIVVSANKAAYRELRMTVNSNVSSITTSGKNLGGFYFGAIPYHNTPFINLPVIESGDDWTDTEATTLEASGVWLLRNNPANTVIISNEAVTTYKTDTLGNPDITFKYVNYLDTLSIIREYFFNNYKADLSQKILTTGQMIAGLPQINKDGYIALSMGYYANLSGINGNAQYGLLRAGSAEAKAFKQALLDTVVVTLSTGTITSESIANIVTQVRNVIVNFTPTFE
jgi:phage tail sheath gpL-like